MIIDRTSLTYLKWFFSTVISFFVIAVLLSVILQPPDGALTRIGYWSERDFGWSKQQPTVTVRANGKLLSNPQVLVLGDSFSVKNIWQSYLAESRNLEILSFHFRDVGCVDNWLRWAVEKHHPEVHTVIIEVVEQSFVPLFRNLDSCSQSLVPKSLEITGYNLEQKLLNSGLTLDVSYLLPTAVNTLQMGLTNGRISSGEVVNVQLSNSGLFSNRKSNRLLYIASDDTKMTWSKNEVADMVQKLKYIQNELAKNGLRFILIVVPDKSSVYRNYMSIEVKKYEYPDVFKKLSSAGVNNVNLLDFFQEAVGDTVDLYLPNDNHLGMQGYKLMASKIADEKF
jgi:hypothetical protein